MRKESGKAMDRNSAANWLVAFFCGVMWLYPFSFQFQTWVLLLSFVVLLIFAVLVRRAIVVYLFVFVSSIALCIYDSRFLICFVPTICCCVAYRMAVQENNAAPVMRDFGFCGILLLTVIFGIASFLLAITREDKMATVFTMQSLPFCLIPLFAVMGWQIFEAGKKTEKDGKKKKQTAEKRIVSKKKRIVFILELFVTLGVVFYYLRSPGELKFAFFSFFVFVMLIVLWKSPIADKKLYE